MTDTFDTDPNEQDPKQVSMSRKDIKRLEAAAQEGREAKTELDQLKKERAYIQAGVPIEDKRAPYFMAGYSGEMTPEAIRSTWDNDFGSGQVTGSSATDQELGALQRAQELVGGGVQVSPNLLAERDAKLASLSQTDPQYPAKFDAIFAEYGGRTGSMSG